MARPEQKPAGGAARRFAINLIGVVGLVYGGLAIVGYLFESAILDFTQAPYRWLQLEGAARLLPPAMVLVVCLFVAYLLERGADGE